MCAGEIPSVGDFVMYRGWCFEVLHADDKKILQVRVDRLVGAAAGEAGQNATTTTESGNEEMDEQGQMAGEDYLEGAHETESGSHSSGTDSGPFPPQPTVPQ